jgi:hypothetical protein
LILGSYLCSLANTFMTVLSLSEYPHFTCHQFQVLFYSSIYTLQKWALIFDLFLKNCVFHFTTRYLIFWDKTYCSSSLWTTSKLVKILICCYTWYSFNILLLWKVWDHHFEYHSKWLESQSSCSKLGRDTFCTHFVNTLGHCILFTLVYLLVPQHNMLLYVLNPYLC